MVYVRPESNASNNDDSNKININIKTPKRVLHFSDGVLEQYSSDEEIDEAPKKVEENPVNPANLSWVPWVWYKTWAAGTTTLSYVDAAGEFFASLFGITTPRYYFELQEHKRLEEQRAKKVSENQGWSESSLYDKSTAINSPPQPVHV